MDDSPFVKEHKLKQSQGLTTELGLSQIGLTLISGFLLLEQGRAVQ